MSTYSDRMLGRILKNLVAQYQPPANGRLELLARALNTPRRKHNFSIIIPRTQFNDYPFHSTHANEWSPIQLTWFFEQSLNAGIRARA
jgi:hypothetical protein